MNDPRKADERKVDEKYARIGRLLDALTIALIVLVAGLLSLFL
jgi:hypothetical protein